MIIAITTRGIISTRLMSYKLIVLGDEYKMKSDPFKEYLRQTEPGLREKGYAWNTAIGLQAVADSYFWRG